MEGAERMLSMLIESMYCAPNDPKDEETIGLQGFPEFNIDPIASSYEDLLPTCCHLALDKPTRLPGDYIFVSNNIRQIGTLQPVSAPLLDAPHPNRPYAYNLKHHVLHESSEFDVLDLEGTDESRQELFESSQQISRTGTRKTTKAR